MLREYTLLFFNHQRYPKQNVTDSTKCHLILNVKLDLQDKNENFQYPKHEKNSEIILIICDYHIAVIHNIISTVIMELYNKVITGWVRSLN